MIVKNERKNKVMSVLFVLVLICALITFTHKALGGDVSNSRISFELVKIFTVWALWHW